MLQIKFFFFSLIFKFLHGRKVAELSFFQTIVFSIVSNLSKSMPVRLEHTSLTICYIFVQLWTRVLTFFSKVR